ncbi:hypothetical protein, partial [Psychrobacter sp. Ps6]
MGLEQQISSLVQASENLTGAVNNKIGEIDKKVDNSVKEITETITKNNIVKFYIDSEFGIDLNSGSSSAPLKTINEAFRRCPTGSTASIYLKRYQRHVFNGASWCYALSLSIMAWGSNLDYSKSYHYDSSTPILEFNGELNTNGSIIIGGYRNTLIIESNKDSKIYFYGAGQFTLGRSRIVLDRNGSAFCGFDQNYLNPVKFSIREGDVVKTSGYLARHSIIFSVDSATGFTY